MDEKISEIIDRIMEMGPYRGNKDDYSRNEPDIDKIAARSGTQTGSPEKPQSYEDWVKSQPRTGMPIGLHKTKKK